MGKITKKPKRTQLSNTRISQALPFNTVYGQHILKNPSVVTSIIDKAAIQPTHVVMEVGPGTGNLSMKILERARKLIAFEVDHRMVAELKKRVTGLPFQSKLDVRLGDVCKVEKWPAFDVCIANLPYQISSPFVFRFLEQRPLPSYAVLMFQREFAERLTALPGSKLYSRLTASVQLLANVEHLMRVKRSEFRPPPKVDSAVVRKTYLGARVAGSGIGGVKCVLRSAVNVAHTEVSRSGIEPINPPPNINYQEWDGLLRIAFLRKNKTLLAIFHQRQVQELVDKNYRIYASARNEEVPADFDIKAYVDKVLETPLRELSTWLFSPEPDARKFGEQRARTLGVNELLRLMLAFNKAGVHFA